MKRRIAASVLSLSMVLGSVTPMTTFAADTEFTSSKLSVVTNKESTLATGVTLDQYKWDEISCSICFARRWFNS